MDKNKYVMLFILFIVVMAVIGILNQNVSKEISSNAGMLAPAAPIVAEERTVAVETMEPIPQAENIVFEQPSLVLNRPLVQNKEAQEPEAIFELPLKDENLPQ